MPPTRPRRLLLKHANVKKWPVYEEKCQDVAEAETIFNDAIKNTLEIAEAPEKLVTTVTLSVESLATTEADFFKTLLNRQEETQKHLNEHSAQTMRDPLHAVRNAPGKKDKHMHPPERTRSTRFDTSNNSVRLGRLTHGSSRDIRGTLVLPPLSKVSRLF